jgi:hypothetical protein
LLLLIKVGHQLCAPLIRTKRSKLYNHFNLVHRLELLRDRLRLEVDHDGSWKDACKTIPKLRASFGAKEVKQPQRIHRVPQYVSRGYDCAESDHCRQIFQNCH